MFDIDPALERPANERAHRSAPGLPAIVAFELRRHRVDHAHTDETVAARVESFLDLMRAFFARKV